MGGDGGVVGVFRELLLGLTVTRKVQKNGVVSTSHPLWADVVIELSSNVYGSKSYRTERMDGDDVPSLSFVGLGLCGVWVK